jgi:hypothetical protein
MAQQETTDTDQYLLNKSFDPDFDLLMVEVMGFDGANMRRLLVNTSGRLQVDVVTGGSSGGGDVQYTEGDTDTTITGTALMWEDASDTLRAVSAAKPLPVDTELTTDDFDTGAGADVRAVAGTVLASDGGGALLKDSAGYGENLASGIAAVHPRLFDGSAYDRWPGNSTDGALVNLGANNDVTVTGSVTVSGSVTANAGTNLNTSLLALESGGNLAAAAASLSVLDDWDESDRVKANIIVGQAGIAGGAGAVAANSPRVTLASDDLAVASLSVLDDWDESDRAKVNLIAGQAGVAAGSGAAGATVLRTVSATDSPEVTSLGVMDDWDDGADSAKVVGSVAHDAVNAGNPIATGMEAIAFGANPTAVAAADRTKLYANRHGIPFLLGGHPNIIALRTNYTAAQTNAALVTVSSGTKIAVTKAGAFTDNANTVNTQVRIGFGTTTTPTGSGTILTHPGLAAGSGLIEGAGDGLIGVGADNEDLRITSSVPTTGSLDTLIVYFTIES